MTTLQDTLIKALDAQDAGDGLMTANLIARVELSLGLLLDQLEAEGKNSAEIAEIAHAVQRFCPRFQAEDIQSAMLRELDQPPT